MADFKDASLWTKLAMIFLCLGFFIMHEPFYGSWIQGNGGSLACGIIGFLCYLTAVVLALGYVFLDELNGNKAAQICIIVFSLIAGLALIIAVAIYGTAKRAYTVGGVTRYTSVGVNDAVVMGTVLGGLLAILAGIFAILDLVGVKGK